MSKGVLLLLELGDTEAEYFGLRQVAPICLASFLVDRHQAAALLVVVATLARAHWIGHTGDAGLQASVALQIHLVSCNLFNGRYAPQIGSPPHRHLPQTPFQIPDSSARALHDAWWFEAVAKLPFACERAFLRQLSCPCCESGAPLASGLAPGEENQKSKMRWIGLLTATSSSSTNSSTSMSSSSLLSSTCGPFFAPAGILIRRGLATGRDRAAVWGM